LAKIQIRFFSSSEGKQKSKREKKNEIRAIFYARVTIVWFCGQALVVKKKKKKKTKREK
jgi:hypothetical protein